MLRFTFLPSSNFTGGTRAETIVLGGLPIVLFAGSREVGGVGRTFGETAWRRWIPGEQWQALLSSSGDLRLDGESPKPDEAKVGLHLDFARRFDRGDLSFGSRLALLLVNGQFYRRKAGVGLAVGHLVSPRLRFAASTEWLAQGHPQELFPDGTVISVSIGLDWAVLRRTEVSVEVPVLRDDTKEPHLAHTKFGPGVVRHALASELGHVGAPCQDRTRSAKAGHCRFVRRCNTVAQQDGSLLSRTIRRRGTGPSPRPGSRRAVGVPRHAAAIGRLQPGLQQLRGHRRRRRSDWG